MDSIPLALRPLVRRLEAVGLSRQELVSVLFVVRLGDNLHRGFYGTFLTLSLVHHLCQKLDITDLTLETDVFCTRWNYGQGQVSVAHEIVWDYDMESVSVLSKIGWSVLKGEMTPKEGLQLISDQEKLITKPRSRLESIYRDFPTRGLVIPLMGAMCTGVFFDGTWVDMGVAAVCGLASGIVACAAARNSQISGIADYLAAIFTGMIAFGSLKLFPDATCFSAQVMGTLYWFLYGTAYVISICELTNNQVVTGTARLASAVLRSYGLAFGVVLGLWLCAYDPSRDISSDCSSKTNQISDLWFILLFPLAGIACLMQFRVRLNDFGVCLVVQIIAYGSQYLIGTVWKQPDFISNLASAFLATISSHVCISIAYSLKISSLQVDKDAFISKKTDGDDEQTDETTVALNSKGESITSIHTNLGGEVTLQLGEEIVSDNIAYLNIGWAKHNVAGYSRVDKLAHARSDLWFCLLPALYLLVPGSKLLQTAFVDIWNTLDDTDIDASELSSLSSALAAIGLAQVVGLRLGFTTLWAWHRLREWCCNCCGKRTEKKKRATSTPNNS